MSTRFFPSAQLGCRSLFPSDQTKIHFYIGLLWGRASAWEQASSRSCSESTSIEEFITRFEQVFDPLNIAGCAGDRLFIISQGSRSVADCTGEFETLAEESSINEPAVLVAYRRGLPALPKKLGSSTQAGVLASRVSSCRLSTRLILPSTLS